MPSNPPAFPTPAEIGPDGLLRSEQYPGMTLRDYFAAAAMQGIAGWMAERDIRAPKHAAELAYFYADAMLEARSKPAT